MHRRAFTLIELLVVIAIVAVLAVVVFLVLNPAQLLQQARDSNRISDMASLNSALSLYLTDASVNGTVSLGSANTVYVSVPDPSATSTAGDQCQGLGLPSLPLSYSYHCAASSTFRMTNATGWLPVSFSTMSNGSPFGQLPIDPVSSTSSRLYYTYSTNGSQFEITAAPESSKYRLGGASDVISGDGGALATVFEKGSKLGLEPLDYGDSALIGWWPLDEGTGTVAYDYSGANATGSLTCQGASCSSPSWAAGKIGSGSILVNPPVATQRSYINMPSVNIPSVAGAVGSVSLWVNPSSTQPGGGWFLRNGSGADENYSFYLQSPSGTYYGVSMQVYASSFQSAVTTAYFIPSNAWSHLVFVFTQGQGVQIYFNGTLQQVLSLPFVAVLSTTNLTIGANPGSNQNFDGYIDDVRIYNRGLSATEVMALYNAGK